MSDQYISELINEIIEDLAELYSSNGKVVDYLSLNLGYTIPKIRELAKSVKKDKV
jgi:hypothetical protein